MTLTVDINMWFKVTTGTLVLKIGSVKGTGFQRGLIGPPPWLRNFAQDHCTLFTIKHSMGKVWARLGQRESRVPSYFMDCIMQYWWKWCWRSLVLKQSMQWRIQAMKNKKKTSHTVVTYIYLYKYSLHELAISIISILTNMKEF